jgi:uncharacterized membrane protein YfcA
MELLGYFAAILMGMTLGMIGGGGSILTVPILVYLFQVDAVLATAYSLFIVGLTSLVGGIKYLQRQEVDIKTALIFGFPSFIGVYLTRSYLVPALPDPVFSYSNLILSKALLVMIVFSILMVLASFSMIKQSDKQKSENHKKQLSPTLKFLLIGLEGLVVGGVTGFVGAGGGFLIIPALVILVGLPMKIAVGTSLFIIAAKSLFGFIGDIQRQPTMDWKLLIILSVISILGLFLGVSLSKKVSEKTLKKSFGYFVLMMGTVILIDQLRRL